MDTHGLTEDERRQDEVALPMLREALASRDGNRLREWVSDYAWFCYKQRFEGDATTFSETMLEFIVALLNDEGFLDQEGSWHLLMLFEYDWALLTPAQRERLLQALESSYPRFADSGSRFLIGELMGKNFADEKAFGSLERLMRLRDDECRALVAHGLEHIIRDSGDPALSHRAVEKLLQMSEDPSKDVRDMAQDTLRRLGVLPREGKGTEETAM